MPEEISSTEQMLSANAAGEMLGVSGKTVVRMMEAGNFPGYKIGSAWKFKRGDIEKYIESRKFERGKAEKKEDAA